MRKKGGLLKRLTRRAAVLHLLQQSRKSAVMVFLVFQYLHEEESSCHVALFRGFCDYLFVARAKKSYIQVIVPF